MEGNENICGRNEECRSKEEKGDERETNPRQDGDGGSWKGRLFVCLGSSRAHKQVETNNILAALREGVDGKPGGLGVCS